MTTAKAPTAPDLERISRERLHGVYGATDSADLDRRYAAWAAEYDRDVAVLGYQVPAMVAAMTARHLPPGSGPILDCGAGTGMVGMLLTALGYDRLEALDLSAAMLTVAEGRGLYRAHHIAELGKPLPFASDSYAACTAAGVFTAAHAPANAFEDLVRVTRPGGLILWGERADGDHAAAYRAVCADLERAGRWSFVAESAPYQTVPLSAADAGVLNQVRVFQVR